MDSCGCCSSSTDEENEIREGSSGSDSGSKQQGMTIVKSSTLRLRFWEKVGIHRPENAKGYFWGTHRPRRYFRPIFFHIYEEEASKSALGMPAHIHTNHIYLMTRMLQKYVMTRNMLGSAYAMAALSFCPSQMKEHLWRVGLHVLKAMDPENSTRFLQYSKLMFDLCYYDQAEVALGLTFEDIVLNSDIRQSYDYLYEKSKKNFADDFNDLLLDGYLGLLEYLICKSQENLQWKSKDVGNEFVLDSADEETDQKTSSTSYERSVLGFYGKKCMDRFERLFKEPGIWDIFLLKYVDLLHCIGNDDKAVQVLTQYRNRNLHNPNAHRYLYWFLKFTKAKKELLEEVLEIAVREDPATELARDLLALQNTKQTSDDRLQVLFEQLDFASNKDKLSLWKELCDELQKGKYTDEKRHNLWKPRQNWWPLFHLRDNEEPGKGNRGLCRIKSRVISMLKKDIEDD